MVSARQKFLGGCLLLAAITAMVFHPMLAHEFLNVDDHVYVYKNPNVLEGLSPGSIKWAFTTLHAEFYHPLTWISLMADTTLYGGAAKGYLTTNLLLHIGNTLLVFYVFWRMTGFHTRSLLIAALFALHPFHVETVAWISDRKDLLCTFFWFASIGAYLHYQQQRHVRAYLILLLFFVLAILAKPMVVTLPCVLLLLDYWPLERVALGGRQPLAASAWRLIKEKLPLFALALVAGGLAIYAQRAGGGLGSLAQYPLGLRLENAAVAYQTYIFKTLWPKDFALFYPYLSEHAAVDVLTAVALLVTVSGLAIFKLRRWPYFAVGWFWFVGTMAPAIGLFKIGDFAMADRYTYIPLIGLFVMLVWGCAEGLKTWRWRHAVAIPLAAVAVGGVATITWHQLKHWENSEALYRHALQVNANSYMAHYGLAHDLAKQGKFPDAARHFRKAVELRPGKAKLWLELGRALAKAGDVAEASAVLAQCVESHPQNREARFLLGLVLALDAQYARAVEEFAEAHHQLVDAGKTDARADCDGSVLYAEASSLDARGNTRESLAALQRILDCQPGFLPARNRLRAHYLADGGYARALSLYHVKNDPAWLQNQIVGGYGRWSKSF